MCVNFGGFFRFLSCDACLESSASNHNLVSNQLPAMVT